MQRANQLKNRLVFVFIILSTFGLFQCDSFFTYSPFSSLLARDPAYLSRADKAEYAKAALAARKTDAMQKALAALLLEDPSLAKLTASECLLMGQIAMVLAGLDQKLGAIETALTGSIAMPPDYSGINSLIATFVPKKNYISQAAQYYYSCDSKSGPNFIMTGTDYFLGAMLILFDGAIAAANPPDIAPVATNPYLNNAKSLITHGVANIKDPMASALLAGLQTLVDALILAP